MSVKKDTISGVKWTAIERISMQAMQFVIGVILARLLCPSDFGVIGMMTIFITLSNTFIDGGFSNALIRKLNCDDVDYSTAFYFNIVFGLIIYCFLYVLSPFIAVFFHTPILSDLIKVLSVVILVNSFCVVQIAKLSREINFKTQAKATFFSILLSGLLGIYLAYTGHGVWSLVYQQVANAIIKMIIIWIEAKWKPVLVFSIESFKNLFGYGSKILISNIIGTLYNQMSTIIIGKFYTSVDLGYYTRGQQFAHLPTIAITDILGKVTFPILSKFQNDDKKLVDVYRKYISITSLIIFFLLLLLAAVSKPLVLILLGEKWSSSVIYLQIFCFAYLFEHICKLNLNLLQVKGRSDLYLRLEIIKKVFAFVLMVASVPLGVIAICLSILVYSQISLILNTYYTGKMFGLGYFKQIGDYLRYLIFSMVAVLPSYGLSYTNFNLYIQFVMGVIIAILIYMMFLWRDEYFVELKNMILNKFIKKDNS